VIRRIVLVSVKSSRPVEIDGHLLIARFCRFSKALQQTTTCDPGHRTPASKQFNIATERCILLAMVANKNSNGA